jgi:hypothetical protein
MYSTCWTWFDCGDDTVSALDHEPAVEDARALKHRVRQTHQVHIGHDSGCQDHQVIRVVCVQFSIKKVLNLNLT